VSLPPVTAPQPARSAWRIANLNAATPDTWSGTLIINPNTYVGQHLHRRHHHHVALGSFCSIAPAEEVCRQNVTFGYPYNTTSPSSIPSHHPVRQPRRARLPAAVRWISPPHPRLSAIPPGANRQRQLQPRSRARPRCGWGSTVWSCCPPTRGDSVRAAQIVVNAGRGATSRARARPGSSISSQHHRVLYRASPRLDLCALAPTACAVPIRDQPDPGTTMAWQPPPL